MAVAAFRKTGTPEGYRGLKYVCLGAGSADERGWSLFSEKPLREKLLALLDTETELRRRLKCFQALLLAYWSFSFESAPPTAIEGWRATRAWLAARRLALDGTQGRKPGWFPVLAAHDNLLGEAPCDRYGKALLAGNGAELREAVEGLAIPSDSWVMEEAVVAQMRAAAKLSHADFKSVLHELLSIATGKAGMSVSKALQVRCVAMLVSRYAHCSDRPEHMALRDAAVTVIGNPWLRRASWDAGVVDAAGRPDTEAREMVNGWLKRRLIKDFFELLSADETGDTRRLDYWLRFEPFIEDMWFALGSDARSRSGESFNDFRNRAKGRLINLDQTTADNNAFIMRMGEYLAVEFGAKGNAFFLFKWERLPQRLVEKLMSGKERVDISISVLKSTTNEERFIHKDSVGKGLSWEQKFDQSICPLVGHRPEELPRRLAGRAAPRLQRQPEVRRVIEADPPNVGTIAEIQQFAAKWNLRIEDRRSAGGALWVIAAYPPGETVTTKLKAWGFRYKAGKGWWRE